VPSEQLKGTPLFDEFIEGDLQAGALAFAEKVVKEKRPLKRVRDLKVDYPNADAFFQFARNTVGAIAKNFPAPAEVRRRRRRGADQALRRGHEGWSARLFVASGALRHAFFAERAATKIRDVEADTPRARSRQVGVIGAGTMGGGIAMNFPTPASR
jgi:3-hydroxyacyl-CoA dehydrogenase